MRLRPRRQRRISSACRGKAQAHNRGFLVVFVASFLVPLFKLVALGILDQFDMAALPVDSVESQHLQIEAMKIAIVAARIGRRRDRPA